MSGGRAAQNIMSVKCRTKDKLAGITIKQQGCYNKVACVEYRKVIAWVQLCTGSKVHKASWFLGVGCSCGLRCGMVWESAGSWSMID